MARTEIIHFHGNHLCLNSRLNDRHRDKPEGVPLLSDDRVRMAMKA
jgi:hypothetical protein